MQNLSQDTYRLLTWLCLPKVGVVTIRNIAMTSKVHSWDINLLKENKVLPNFDDGLLNEARTKADNILDSCREHEIAVISILDESYPPLLKNIKDAPPLLYVKGSMKSLHSKCAAVVGTRKASEAGLKIAGKVAHSLAENGYSIVSGLALGIDTASHKGVLEISGITIAILAHGLHTIAPSSNKALAQEILDKNGALISEHPPGTPARPPEFVRRNRIQSGMSLFSVIIETGEVGGTIYQAQFTKTQGKEVYVIIPPNDNPIYNQFNYSGGCMIIDKMGGIKVTSTMDLLNKLNVTTNQDNSNNNTQDQLGFNL